MVHLGKSIFGVFEILNSYGTSWKINEACCAVGATLGSGKALGRAFEALVALGALIVFRRLAPFSNETQHILTLLHTFEGGYDQAMCMATLGDPGAAMGTPPARPRGLLPPQSRSYIWKMLKENRTMRTRQRH